MKTVTIFISKIAKRSKSIILINLIMFIALCFINGIQITTNTIENNSNFPTSYKQFLHNKNLNQNDNLIFSYNLFTDRYATENDISSLSKANLGDYKLNINEIKIYDIFGDNILSLSISRKTHIINFLKPNEYLKPIINLSIEKKEQGDRFSFLKLIKILFFSFLTGLILSILIYILSKLISNPNPGIKSDHSHFKYRPDIDGLRALAVFLVILFHFRSDFLSGGFVGVDIFFVISGFLITKIIYHEMLHNNFQFKNFYARRMRRIFPLMYFMLFVVFVFGSYLIMPGELNQFLDSFKANLIYYYNFYLLNHGSGYFDISSNQQPLLHMWSLCVEEQFYLLFPLILFIIIKIENKSRSIIQLITLYILFIASLISSVYYISDTSIDYYMIYTRAYELLAGSILAVSLYIAEKKQLKPKFIYNPIFSNFISLLGLVLIIFCSTKFTSELGYPGYIGLVPTLGAVFFILGGALSLRNIVTQVFSNKIIVSLGLISYSLYLWHWPVLAFYRYETYENKIPLETSIILFLLILFLSCSSYFLIEKPFKKIKLNYTRILFICFIFPVVTLSFLKSKIKFQMSEKEQLENTFPYHIFCNEDATNACVFGKKDNSEPKVALIGDSHGTALSPFFDKLAQDNHINMFMASSGGCPSLLVLEANKEYLHKSLSNRPSDNVCLQILTRFTQELHKYNTIIFIQRWDGYVKNADYLAALKRSLDYLQTLHKNIIIIGDVPLYNEGEIQTIYRRNRLKQIFPFFPLPKVKLTSINKNTNKIIEDFVKSYSNVYYYDMQSELSEKITTYPYINNFLIYIDEGHLNPEGSLKLYKFFKETKNKLSLINSILKK